MKDKDTEHEIGRIARELGCFIEVAPGLLNPKLYTANLWINHGESILVTTRSANHTEAKDALLKKLQDIVCPDYSELKAENERLKKEVEKAIDMARASVAGQVVAFAYSKEYILKSLAGKGE